MGKVGENSRSDHGVSSRKIARGSRQTRGSARSIIPVLSTTPGHGSGGNTTLTVCTPDPARTSRPEDARGGPLLGLPTGMSGTIRPDKMKSASS